MPKYYELPEEAWEGFLEFQKPTMFYFPAGEKDEEHDRRSLVLFEEVKVEVCSYSVRYTDKEGNSLPDLFHLLAVDIIPKEIEVVGLGKSSHKVKPSAPLCIGSLEIINPAYRIEVATAFKEHRISNKALLSGPWKKDGYRNVYKIWLNFPKPCDFFDQSQKVEGFECADADALIKIREKWKDDELAKQKEIEELAKQKEIEELEKEQRANDSPSMGM